MMQVRHALRIFVLATALPGALLAASGTDSTAGSPPDPSTTKTDEPAQMPVSKALIDVSATNPIVDLRSTVTGESISGEAMERLPLARNYSSFAVMVPGVVRDDTGPMIYGSTWAENQYAIEGINVSGIYANEDLKVLNLEFVDEVQILTGGLPAEYGRASGGIVSGVVKSGTNQFRGSVFGYRDANRAQTTFIDRLPAEWIAYARPGYESDAGLQFSGPIWSDRVWFFAGYDRAMEEQILTRFRAVNVPGFSLPAGVEESRDTVREVFTGKLTFAPRPQHLLSATIFSDPSTKEGALRLPDGPPSTFMGEYEQGGNSYTARYSGTYASRLNVDLTIGAHRESSAVWPQSAEVRIIDQSYSPRVVAGGYGQYFQYAGERAVRRLETSLHLGNHTLKAGADYERADEVSHAFFSGGDRIWVYCRVPLVNRACPSDADRYYMHTSWVDELSGGFKPDDPSTWVPSMVNPRWNRMRGTSNAFYLQDSWTLRDLTVNAGVRVDRQQIYARGDVEVLQLNNPAPRLGATWSPGASGRHKVYAFAGRYFESMGTHVSYYSGNAYQVHVRNMDPAPGNFTPDDRAPAFPNGLRYQFTGAGVFQKVDDGLRGPSMNEYLLGYDVRTRGGFTVGVKGTWRELGRAIENMPSLEGQTGDWRGMLVNPGYGRGASMRDFAGNVIPTPKPERNFRGLEVHARRHFSGGSQLYASYLWSRLSGNYEGPVDGSTGEWGLHEGAAYNAADYLVNATGVLSTDRTHQVKFAGSYRVDRGLLRDLDLGAFAYWYSGTPLSAMGASWTSFWESYFLTPRGALGRGPSQYELDLHVGYPLPFFGRRAVVALDVFNALDRQAPLSLDQRYNTWSGRCGGVPAALCNGDGGIKPIAGTTDPVGAIENPRATATNPHFLKPISWTQPRVVRLGVRYAF